jgi:hypothetical protein
LKQALTQLHTAQRSSQNGSGVFDRVRVHHYEAWRNVDRLWASVIVEFFVLVGHHFARLTGSI